VRGNGRHQIALRLTDDEFAAFSDIAWAKRLTRAALAWQITAAYLREQAEQAQDRQLELSLGNDPANRDNTKEQ
jgi:hypothetical protein